ncbi:MAG: glutamate-5-semialdehyde dehydrogenase [Spirochaetes bacterium]|nr:glutamate-5-semialdehyde dehydrogenase [Spirochaetota bacterium]
MNELEKIVLKSHEAKSVAANLSTEVKNEILILMKEELIKKGDIIIKANRQDYQKAEKDGLSKAMLDRLLLDEKRIVKMAESLQEIADLPDPIGEVISGTTRPNGLKLRQIRVPLGVVLIVYEARPNVTVDAAGLSFKSGNSVILRGGSNSFHSNKTIVSMLQEVLKRKKLPEAIITFIPKPEREVLMELIKFNQYIDVLIPRGGKDLIEMVVENSRIPVIFHAEGICHLFVDESAEKKMCESIVINAKTQRPGVCNAIETLLIHKKYPYIKELLEELIKKKVELRGDPETAKLNSAIKKAVEKDWRTEYLDMILSVKLVDSAKQAIDHINQYGSHHSDGIITESYTHSEKFLKEVDSATVYVNASTRFTDGGEFGFGAEMGISTQKLHVRGPMGLVHMTSTKYVIYGEGQIRS